MKLSKLLSFILSCLLPLCIMVTVTSCKSVSLNHIGLEVPAYNRIPLEADGPHKGSWESEDVTVQYQYKSETNRLAIKGLIDFSSALKNFSVLEYFYLWIHFVGADNKIVGNKEISPQVYFYEIIAVPFEAVIALPPNTKAFVFSYSGFASDGDSDGDGGPINWSFWKTPDS